MSKLFNLLAITSLAILGCSFGSTPVNALSTHHLARSPRPEHNVLAKKKRSLRRRCAPRTPPTSSSSAATPPPSSSAAAAANAEGAPGSGSSSNGGSSSSGSGGSGTPSSGSSSNGGGSQPPSGGAKVCFAWGGDDQQLAAYVTPNTKIVYNWTPVYPSTANSLGLSGIPMLWGTDQITQFQNTVVQGYSWAVLGFNEPDQGGQSNLSPSYAASLWQQYIQPLKAQGYFLVSPATSSAPAGLTWMQEFFSACGGCTFDAIAVHWYDVTSDLFIQYLELWYSTFGMNLWVTEFACQNYNNGPQCTNDYIPEFMSTVTDYMNSVDWVTYYCPFGFMEVMPDGVNPADALMDGNGNITPLGSQVIWS